MAWAAARAIGLTPMLARNGLVTACFAVLFLAASAPAAAAPLDPCASENISQWAFWRQQVITNIEGTKSLIINLQVDAALAFVDSGDIPAETSAKLQKAEQHLAAWKRVAAKVEAGYTKCLGHPPFWPPGLLDNDEPAPRPNRPVPPPNRPAPPPPTVPQPPPNPGTQNTLLFRSSDTSDTLTVTAPPDFHTLQISSAHWLGEFVFSMTCPAGSQSSQTYSYDCNATIAGAAGAFANTRGGGRVHVTLNAGRSPMQLILDTGTFTVTDRGTNPPQTYQVAGARNVWIQQ